VFRGFKESRGTQVFKALKEIPAYKDKQDFKG
jgi:hypothetical protein